MEGKTNDSGVYLFTKKFNITQTKTTPYSGLQTSRCSQRRPGVSICKDKEQGSQNLHSTKSDSF